MEVKAKKTGVVFDCEWVNLKYRVDYGMQKSVEAVAIINNLMGEEVATAGNCEIIFRKETLSEPRALDLLFLAPINSSNISHMSIQFLDYAKVQLIPE